jgi:serine/threonine-protein kinase RsbW
VQQRLTVSRIEEVPEVEQRILDAASRQGYGEPDCFAIKLALEEALANGIKHGNRSDPSKRVDVTYEIDPQSIRITICDEGRGFDPSALADPTLDENLAKPFGRGVMLMRTYMNDVAFNDRGNCVTMVKHRSPAGA